MLWLRFQSLQTCTLNSRTKKKNKSDNSNRGFVSKYFFLNIFIFCQQRGIVVISPQCFHLRADTLPHPLAFSPPE